MPNPAPDEEAPPSPAEIPPAERWRARLRRLRTFDLREQWWRLLDALERNRTLRRSLYAAAAAAALAAACWIWIYPWWTKRNAAGIARQWMAAGRLDYAAQVVQRMIADDPDAPETWALAADLSRQAKNPAAAMDYSRRAAGLAPADPIRVLAWVSDALLADRVDEAARALARVPPAFLAASSAAQRMAGEIERRRLHLTPARDHFEAALRLDGPLAIDEVPLGTILLASREPAERQRGLALLSKWSADPAWGANALRTLLADALANDDRPAMLQWAERLRVHPACTLGDLPNCLLALSKADPTRFAAVLALLESKQSASAGQAALLVGWLNQIGRSAEAARWVQSLPATLTRRPPVIVVAAEAFRVTGAWTELNDLAAAGAWGRDAAFLRWIYGMEAAQALGRTQLADERWRTLQADAKVNGTHALFAADTLYVWGRRDKALTLLWMAAEQSGVAVEALGTLARHYQSERDAAGEYQVFRRLHSLRAQDPAIANNYAYFAAVTGNDPAAIEPLARHNHESAPANAAYLATYAFVLSRQNRAAEAVALLQPLAAEWPKSPPLALAYGLALASAGRKDDARAPLSSLDPSTLTVREAELVADALRRS